MSRAFCWCGHAEQVHHMTGCASCRQWRTELDPYHRFRPIASLRPIPASLWRKAVA